MLTLDLARAALDDGLGLKDATPYNVLFEGCQPVFVDIGSFERRNTSDPIWLPYAQFVRCFLLPLAAFKSFGLQPDRVFTTARDGLTPVEVYRMSSGLRRLLPPLLGLSTLPAWLDRSKSGAPTYAPRQASSMEQARFILARTLAGLSRTLANLAPASDRQSTWSNYQDSIDQGVAALKASVVRAAVERQQAKTVLDVGCNTGELSEAACQSGARVVGIDRDAAALGRAWQRARAKRLDFLPLSVDLARPTPAIGWNNDECSSFVSRAQGQFDCVLLLAVVHHLLVAERIPLSAIVDLSASLSRRTVVVEFIPPSDPKFKEIARGRDALFAELTAERFEHAWQQRFSMIEVVPVPGCDRRLYVLERKAIN